MVGGESCHLTAKGKHLPADGGSSVAACGGKDWSAVACWSQCSRKGCRQRCWLVLGKVQVLPCVALSTPMPMGQPLSAGVQQLTTAAAVAVHACLVTERTG